MDEKPKATGIALDGVEVPTRFIPVDATVKKWGATVSVSDSYAELIETNRQIDEIMRKSMLEWMNSTPEERAERQRERTRQQLAANLAEREAATHVPFSVESLGERLGWGPKYMEHVCQTYCTCNWDIEGWSTCEHARELGINESD